MSTGGQYTQSEQFNLKKWGKLISSGSASLAIAAGIIRLISAFINVHKVILSIHFM